MSRFSVDGLNGAPVNPDQAILVLVILVPKNTKTATLHQMIDEYKPNGAYQWTELRVENAIKILRCGVTFMPSDKGSLRSLIFSTLGELYNSRFTRVNKLVDINLAVICNGIALLLRPLEPNKPAVLHNLGAAHFRRFEYSARIEDLDKAVEYFQEASEMLDDTVRRMATGNLALALEARFELQGDATDIYLAIDHQHRLLLTTRARGVHRALEFYTLSSLYESLFFRLSKDPEHLAAAIEYGRRAVLLVPNSHRFKPKMLVGLGQLLASQYRDLDDFGGINEAFECNRRAISLVLDTDPEMPIYLSSQAGLHYLRYKRFGQRADLDDSIRHEAKAVSLSPENHTDGAIWLQNLGRFYYTRFERCREPTDIEAAMHCFKGVAQRSSGYPYTRFHNALLWGSLAINYDISSCIPAYKQAMALVTSVISLGAPSRLRYSYVAQEIKDAAVEAAEAAIRQRRFDLALEWLEQGRSIVWRQLLQLRAPLDDLFSARPRLTERLQETARELDDIMYETSESELPISVFMSRRQARSLQQRRLATQWEALVHQVRDIPGFERFLLPKELHELLETSRNGAVVVINVHANCDALVIPQNARSLSDIVHAPLAGFSSVKAALAHGHITSSLQRQGFLNRGIKRGCPSPKDLFEKVLNMLWVDVAEPIMALLGFTKILPTVELPRITWCTTGLLSSLPLHAAGISSDPNTVLHNLAVSSYTPTLSALLVPKTTHEEFSGLLAVGQTSTPGLQPLPYIVNELVEIRRHTGRIKMKQVVGEEATIATVLAEIETHSWVHIACHGTQNTINPTSSCFHLHDGSLDLKTITGRKRRTGKLAYLSACQTATGDKGLPDEAVHLAAGMIMAGYPSVVGTMWSIVDKDAPLVAGKFYELMLDGGLPNAQGAARALHSAVANLRKEIGVNAFARWVPYIHMGV